jgi:hypothetical protein
MTISENNSIRLFFILIFPPMNSATVLCTVR